MRRIRSIAVGALLVAVACGGGSNASEPTPTKAAAIATLPPATAPPATLPAATAPAATLPAAATPVATASSGTSNAELVAKGKVVFQTAGGDGCQSCHGTDGKGMTKDGNTAPNIRAATEQKLRDALRGGVPLMSNLKLTDEEITAVLAYLAYLDLQ